MKLKADDIAFWILIMATIAVILWLLRGSPITESALIAIGSLIISSEIFLFKKYFEVDKNTGMGFMRVKRDLDIIKNDVNNLKKEMNYKLDNIERLIKSKK